jgi:hypothetical protein
MPAEPAAADWLDAVILAPSVDPEGTDVTYRYRWTVDGLPADFLDDLEAVWPEETLSGQTWEVSVAGVDEGGGVGPVGTATATVRGSPPSIRGAWLGPLGATVDDTLFVEAQEWEDPDGGEPAFLYEWWVDGRTIEATRETLSPTAFSEGSSVFVVVTPVDDEFQGRSIDSNSLVIRGVDPCGALVLDGDDHVTVGGDPLPVLNDFAVEAWVSSTGAGTVASTRAGDGGWRFGLSAGRSPELWIAGVEVVATEGLPEDGAMHHIAATRNDAGGATTLFIDGREVGSMTTERPAEGGPLVIGRSSESADGYFTGVLDDLRISSLPRFRDGFDPARYWAAEPTAVALWHWSEGQGTVSADIAGTGREATLVGAEWSSVLTACDVR